MDTLVYKGILCRAGTFRVKGENRPALYCIGAPDGKAADDAGFEEIHMAGPWVKILTDDEYREITDRMTAGMEMKEMFREFDFNGKPDMLIREVNGLALPDDYLSFMNEHNGGEGPLGENNYGRFYRLEELKEINEQYGVSGSWPGYVVIGGIDDMLWAYNPYRKIYCQIDSCNTDEDTFSTVSGSFKEFLIKMDEELSD